MKKVLFIRHGYYPADPRLKKQVRAMAENNFDIEVICLKGKGQPSSETLDNAKILRLPLHHKRASLIHYIYEYSISFVFFFTTISYKSLFKHYDYIIIHTLPDYLSLTAILPKILGSKIITDFHEPTPELIMTKYGLTSKHLLVKFAKFFEQFIIRFSDFSITVTKALRKRYIESGADPKKVFVVSNAIDETDFNIDISTFIRNKKVSDFLLVTHGTIEERYGHEIVIRAVNKLKTKYPDLKFIITGDGSYTPKLKKLVQELNCKNNVKFLGYLPFDQLLETLANSDAGIISMYSTPYSELIDTNKMYEYFNLDLPVLVPKLNPITETFNTSEVIFFEPGNSDDLALKIEELILNPGAKISLIKNARLKYDKLKWDVEKKSFLKLFMQN